MSTEFKHNRRRTNSTAHSLRSNGSTHGHARGISRQILTAKSTHTSDDFLKPFLTPSFDPAAFLNSNIPPIQGGSANSNTAEVSSQAQSLVSQLNAHTTRLSNTLTGLTDDILRSGSRLAYEVELLRGETVGLGELMGETLQEDIKKFVPEGISMDAESDARREEDDEAKDGEGLEPAYVKQLQTLTLVRARLESVIKTFGDAMEFTFPPSELSVGSGFLSVSAPDPGSAQQSSEEKGQQVLKQYREEIADILSSSPEDPVEGIAKAAQRIEELKELTAVWKGTAEEKGRHRFIDSLAKMVEDKHKELMKAMETLAKRENAQSIASGRPRKSSVSSRDGQGSATAAAAEESKLPGGFGLLNQLQRLRSGL